MKENKSIIKRMLSYPLRNKRMYIVVLFAFAFQDFGFMLFSMIMKNAGIHVAVNKGNITLFLIGLAMLYVVINLVLSYGMVVIEKVRINIENELRKDVIKNVFDVPISAIDASNLKTILLYDVSCIADFCTTTIGVMFMPALTTIMCIIIGFVCDARIGLMSILIILPCIIFNRLLIKSYVRKQNEKKEEEKLQQEILEKIIKSNLMAKSFQIENKLVNEASKINENIKKINLFSAYICKWQRVIGDVSETFIIFVFFVFAGKLYLEGTITLGELAIIPELFVSEIDGISQLLEFKWNMSAPILRAKRVFDAMETIQNEVCTEKNDVQGLSISNLSFKYPNGKKIFEHYEFSVLKPQLVAITGEVGKGKSTLFKIILGLEKENEGIIKAEGYKKGKNVDDTWLQNFSYVDQETTLLHMSIKENITLCRDCDADRFISIVNALGIDKIVSKVDNGFDSDIGKGNVLLSGGERQLIAIARAMMSEAKIVLLDEATSAMDEENEKKTMNLLKKMSKDKIILLITHRESCIKFANTVVEV